MRRARTQRISPRPGRPLGSLTARLCGAALAAGLALLGPGMVAHAETGTGVETTDAETSVVTPPAASEEETVAPPQEESDVPAEPEAPVEQVPEVPVPEVPEAPEVSETEAQFETDSESDLSTEPEAPADTQPESPADAASDDPADAASDDPADAASDLAEPATPTEVTAEVETEAEPAQMLPDVFTVAVSLIDSHGDPVMPAPEGFSWSVTATGPVTYSSEGVASSMVAFEPVAGTYRLDIAFSEAAAAQTTLSEMQCSYMTDFDDIDTLETDLQYMVDGDWHVDVRATHATTCVFLYEVTGPLPDPSFELTTIGMMTGVDADGDRVHVGEESDWAVALVAADGSTAGTVAPGGKIQVPAGEYTPRLVASGSAQPGFDPSVWKSNGWNCLAAESTPYGGTITLEPGGVVACNTFVSDATADLAVDITRSSDVQLGWEGVYGEVGTEFDIIVDVQNHLDADFASDPIADVRFVLTMGDNVALVDPTWAPAGWSLVSAESGVYTYVLDGAFEPGQQMTLTFRGVLTAAYAESGVQACVVTSVIELSRMNNCAALVAVADGDGDEDPPTEPEDPDVEEPEDPDVEQPEDPDTEQPKTEDPEQPETEQPKVDDPEQPRAEEPEQPKAEDPRVDEVLARTGADSTPMALAALTAAAVMGLGALLLIGRTRRSTER